METKQLTLMINERVKDAANHMSINIEHAQQNFFDILGDVYVTNADDISRIVFRALLLKELDRCDSGLNSEMRAAAHALYSEL